MALPDISTLTLEELAQLSQAVNTLYVQKQQEDRDEAETAKESVANSIAELKTLLGDPSAPAWPGPGSGVTPTISNLQKHTGSAMASNASILFPLILEGLRIQTVQGIALSTWVQSQQSGQ